MENAADLKEFGIKAVFAQSLFKHVLQWKAEGVPADIFAQRIAASDAVSAVSATLLKSVGETNISASDKSRKQHEQDQRVRQQILQWEEDKAVKIRELRDACSALENKRHERAGCFLFEQNGQRQYIRCKFICSIADFKPTTEFEMNCPHDWNLIYKVEQLAGGKNPRASEVFRLRKSEVERQGSAWLMKLHSEQFPFASLIASRPSIL